ncbi:MAG: UvrD-helicase domain-containing protein [Bacteroidia bacterium]|nr:UvrD-helicase domain-containing protein [Bacteroidia bacterium]
MSLRVILASAGAGKTQELASLSVRALDQRLSSSTTEGGVLAITFTRNAAAELKARILSVAIETGHNLLARKLILNQAPLYTSTIDGLIRELYFHLAPLLGLAAYQDLIVEEEDQIEVRALLISELLQKLKGSPSFLRTLRQAIRLELETAGKRVKPEAILHQECHRQLTETPLQSHIRLLLHKWHTSLIHPTEEEKRWLSILPTQKGEYLITSIYQALHTYRLTAQRLFLSDLTTLVWLTARHVPELLTERASLYTHILIDEAQDTSPLQWEILWPLLQEVLAQNGNVTLIGDPKQSIYAWRGADYSQVLHAWDKADEQKTLSDNFRSHASIVCFNNNLYSKLPSLLEKYKSSGKKRNSYSYATKAIEELKHLYNISKVCQTPKYISSCEAGGVEIKRLTSRGNETERAKAIREIIDFLNQKGVPAEETAFLVRRNEDVAKLRSLLPDLPLQVQSLPIGNATTLTVTLRYFHQPGPVESCFLRWVAGEDAPYLEQELDILKSTVDESDSTPLQKWKAFYKVGELWWSKYFPSQRAHWMLFLSRLYTLLLRHPFYGRAEILRWWENKGKYIELQIPSSPGIYPVTTIHRAKGLAWRAVILPFVEWDLLSTQWRSPTWQKVPASALPPSLRKTLSALDKYLPTSDLTSYLLPLKISSDTKEEVFSELYFAYFKSQVIENVNLHYVATTRAREYLFLITSPPLASYQKGANSWGGFWTEENLGKQIIP